MVACLTTAVKILRIRNRDFFEFHKLGWVVYLFQTFYLNAPGVVTKSFVSVQLTGII